MVKGFRERSAKYRAVIKNRRAMRSQGLSRYEVRGLARDKDLVKRLARKLATDDGDAGKLRAMLERELMTQKPKYKNLVDWLRASPLVGVDWYIERPFEPGRKIDL